MDFVRLVEDGKYKKEDLRPEDKAFVDGMTWVMEEVIKRDKADLEIFYGIDDEKNAAPTVSKLVYELQVEAIEDLRDCIYAEICQAIVCMLDDYQVDGEEIVAPKEEEVNENEG